MEGQVCGGGQGGRTGLWGRIGWKDRSVGEDRVEGQVCGGG